MQYIPNQYVPSNDENKIGCVKLEPNFPECITLDLQPQEMPRDFAFRQVFGPESTQQEVFETTAMPLAMHVLNGYNGTYFVYGQTGTGKTHSMGVLNQIDATSQGIVPNSLQYIFDSLHDMQAKRIINDW